MQKILTPLAGAILVSGALIVAGSAAGVDRLQNGYELTESFSNEDGDAEAFYRIVDQSEAGFGISYSSTLGTFVTRSIRADDRARSNTYAIVFANEMPRQLPGTTSLGISSDTLVALRENGSVPLTLMYSSTQSTIGGSLVLDGEMKFPVIIGNQVVELNALRAHGVFRNGAYAAEGKFVFLNNRRNPLTLAYEIKFNSERAPRLLRITRVVSGPAQASAMEQALSTLGKLEIYGIHFDFGKATIQANTDTLLTEIANMLKNNPGWTLSIQGHTDSIGGEAVNQNLSLRRAQSIVSALVNRFGIGRNRLEAVGHGMSQPKATNNTLEGRALNRRVELVRTDT